LAVLSAAVTNVIRRTIEMLARRRDLILERRTIARVESQLTANVLETRMTARAESQPTVNGLANATLIEDWALRMSHRRRGVHRRLDRTATTTDRTTPQAVLRPLEMWNEVTTSGPSRCPSQRSTQTKTTADAWSSSPGNLAAARIIAALTPILTVLAVDKSGNNVFAIARAIASLSIHRTAVAVACQTRNSTCAGLTMMNNP
jgi:hypothetical protein